MMKKKQTATRLPSLGRNRRGQESTHAQSDSGEAGVIRIRRSNDKVDLLNDGVMNAIHEYLVKKNYLHTVEAFQREMMKIAVDRPNRKQFDEQLVEVGFSEKAFDEGKRDWFFEVWRRYVPMALRMGDEVTIKLEFFIHIYFTVYQMHPSLNPTPLKVLLTY